MSRDISSARDPLTKTAENSAGERWVAIQDDRADMEDSWEIVIEDDENMRVAFMSVGRNTPARARLIAAAPDLLCAMQELMRIREWTIQAGGKKGPLSQTVIEQLARMQIPAVDAALAAIAKATGRSPAVSPAALGDPSNAGETKAQP